jgi:hypothetical protein
MNRCTRGRFSPWLVRRMAELNLGVEAFAKQAGKSRVQVWAWRRGSSLPPSTQVPAIALLLGATDAEVQARINNSRRAGGPAFPGRPASRLAQKASA